MQTSSTNIIGGPYIGGNFWAYPNGTGFSQTCADADIDGICDLPYVLDMNNTDFLPLANFTSDTTSPDSVTNLRNITYASNYINWTWTDPANPDFDKVMIYLNGAFQRNVTNGTQYYNATVAPGTYTIGTRTVDTNGNINTSMVTNTSTTILPSIRFINGTVIDSVSKAVIPGVTVSTSSFSNTTNATGFYSLAIASGSYDLTATFDIRYYTNSSITVSTVGSKVAVQDIELLKKPTGNITGSVTRSV